MATNPNSVLRVFKFRVNTSAFVQLQSVCSDYIKLKIKVFEKWNEQTNETNKNRDLTNSEKNSLLRIKRFFKFVNERLQIRNTTRFF